MALWVDHGDQLAELLDIDPIHLPEALVPVGLDGASLQPLLDGPERATFTQFPRPWFYHKEPELIGYPVRTEKHRYAEWQKFGTRDVVARELCADGADQRFESENLANDPFKPNRSTPWRGCYRSRNPTLRDRLR